MLLFFYCSDVTHSRFPQLACFLLLNSLELFCVSSHFQSSFKMSVKTTEVSLSQNSFWVLLTLLWLFLQFFFGDYLRWFYDLLFTVKQGVSKLRPTAQSGPRRHFVNNEKILNLRKICWFCRMWHIPKQSHYVRFPALELLCNNLCGRRTKGLETLAVDIYTRLCEMLTVEYFCYCQWLLDAVDNLENQVK